MRKALLCILMLLTTGVVLAEEQVNTETPQGQPEEALTQTPAEQKQIEGVQEKTENKAKTISGMSILGNQEAPKSLVIVPWKSSEIGSSMDISTMLDDSKLPVDKEVFMRALHYYEIRSGPKP